MISLDFKVLSARHFFYINMKQGLLFQIQGAALILFEQRVATEIYCRRLSAQTKCVTKLNQSRSGLDFYSRPVVRDN